MSTKHTDAKGRVSLGERFANRTVIVDQIDDCEVRVTLARVISEREAWLYANPKAKAAVGAGLKQAKAGRFAKAPNLAADARLVKRLGGGID